MPESDKWDIDFREKIVIALAALVAMLLVRLVALSVAPHFNTDEGFWTISAKNYLLFHDWTMGNWYHYYLSPFYSYLALVTFYLIGPGIVHARILSVVMGIGSVGLLFLLAKRLYGERTAWVAALLLGFSGPFLVMNRAALLESTQTFMVLLSFTLWTSRSRRAQALAGFAYALTLLTKINSLYLILPFYAYEVRRAYRPDGRKRLAHLWTWRWTLFLTISIGGACLGYGLLYLHDPVHFVAYWKRELGFRSHGSWLWGEYRAASTATYFATRSPFLLTISGLGMVTAIGEKHRKDRWKHLLPMVWFWTGFLFFAPMVYKPSRYYIPLLPALCMIAAWWVVESLSGNPGSVRRKVSPILLAAMLSYGTVAFVGYYFVQGHASDTGVRVTAWVKENVPREDVVIGPHYLCVSIPNRAYGFWGFLPKATLTEEIVRKYHLRYALYDDQEWKPWVRKFHSDTEEFLQSHGRLRARIDGVEIWELQ